MDPKLAIDQISDEPTTTGVEHVDLDQIVERLAWTPAERLRYLLDMLTFEEKARHAKPMKS